MSADLTTYLLLTAAGAAMVGLTLPSLFESSHAAARTFKGQVSVLEQGASSGGPSLGSAGGLNIGGSGWNLNVGVGPNGVSAVGGVAGLSITGQPPPLPPKR